MWDWIEEAGESLYGVVTPGAEEQREESGEQYRGYTSDGSLLGDIGQTLGDLGRGISQEGIGGLLDASGMMDRQAAQRELSGNFQVVGDDFVGPRNENQVTEEEYQQIARTYSDIRMDRSDLQLDLPADMDPADAEAYREGAMTDIGRILQTRSGRDLIGQLSDNQDADGNHRITRIAGNDPDPQNAHASGNPGDVGTHEHPGAGGDSTVTYNPGSVWQPLPGSTHGEPWMPMRSDVQLFHELTHSLHQTHGTLADGTVTNAGLDAAGVPAGDLSRRDAGDIDRAEHQAVGIGEFGDASISENEYRRARMRIAGGGVGVVGGVGGDEDMQLRETYGEHGLGDPIGP